MARGVLELMPRYSNKAHDLVHIEAIWTECLWIGHINRNFRLLKGFNRLFERLLKVSYIIVAISGLQCSFYILVMMVFAAYK
jgi:hypothetical protein